MEGLARTILNKPFIGQAFRHTPEETSLRRGRGILPVLQMVQDVSKKKKQEKFLELEENFRHIALALQNWHRISTCRLSTDHPTTSRSV